MKKLALLVALVLATALTAIGDSEKPLLLQRPALSRTQIAFVFGDDLWVVGRDGGDAQRLTAGLGIKTDPFFSPDGKWIAFSGQYAGNLDVYVVASTGGEPRRLTYHPGADLVAGWTPDGKSVLFASTRNGDVPGESRLFTIPVEGGFPTQLPLPMAYEGSYSPDGTHIAYRPLPRPFGNWKRYRGGTQSRIWIANLADSAIEAIPRTDSNDLNPMWVGNTVYFLSDRNGPLTLFGYDTGTKKVSEVLANHGLDFKSASAGPGAIVYEQFGTIHLYDLAARREHQVDIRVASDFAGVRPRFEPVEKHILTAGISPSGARAVFEAHGEILTVPAEKGDIRNLTNSPSIADRDPAWSPDGKWIAYFSDESGEYALHLRQQNGMGDVRKINLGNPPSFFYEPRWSPDSKKLAYTDKRLNVWYVDLDKGTPVKVDTDLYDTPYRGLKPDWAPDSRWIAYTKQLPNHLRAVFTYSLEDGKPTQVTDGMSDAESAQFDKNGKYLYFTASTDIGPTTGWIDMSSFPFPVTRSVYLIVLRKDLPSPLAPESDEEKVAPAAKGPEGAAKDSQSPAGSAEAAEKEKGKEKEKDKSKEPEPVRIDFDNISQRILALPIPARSYLGILSGKTGQLFLAEEPLVPGPGPRSFTLHKFDLTTHKFEQVLAGLTNLDISFNGEKMLYHQGEHWFITGTAQPPKPGEGQLKMDSMEVWVDPRAEWKQMYDEVWRIERDFLYDPNLHGLPLEATKKKYAAYLDGIASRADLNYLFQEMLAQINIGHMYVFGGDIPEVKPIRIGLLGADYTIDSSRYRFARVYNGENWNPQLHAPLTQPGVNVVAGEYLLAVNGRELHGADNIYSFFQETVGKQTVLKVGSKPDGSGSREVTVVPIENEAGLRNRAWIEDNLHKVERMTGGKVAYVYLPNTGGAGYTNFNRYYFAGIGKEGAVIDERFNGGGAVADYMIEYMQRQVLHYFMTREGEPFPVPAAGIFGPKVMVINQMAGSGGDDLPWMFRRAKLGPLVGERTWGGLVGIYNYPQLIDGGFVTAPRVAFFTPEGTWDVENHGVAPDIEVELDPHAWREGHDSQLEKAVEVELEALKHYTPPQPHIPPFPNYYKGRGGSTAAAAPK